MLGLGKEVEDLISSADLALEGVKIPCNVSEQMKDLEPTVVKDNENSVDDGVNNVITLQVQDGEQAERSHSESIAMPNGELRSINNEFSESFMSFETTASVRAMDSHLSDDMIMEQMENRMNSVLSARDSTPLTAQKKTNFRFHMDSVAAQECEKPQTHYSGFPSFIYDKDYVHLSCDLLKFSQKNKFCRL